MCCVVWVWSGPLAASATTRSGGPSAPQRMRWPSGGRRMQCSGPSNFPFVFCPSKGQPSPPSGHCAPQGCIDLHGRVPLKFLVVLSGNHRPSLALWPPRLGWWEIPRQPGCALHIDPIGKIQVWTSRPSKIQVWTSCFLGKELNRNELQSVCCCCWCLFNRLFVC